MIVLRQRGRKSNLFSIEIVARVLLAPSAFASSMDEDFWCEMRNTDDHLNGTASNESSESFHTPSTPSFFCFAGMIAL